MFLQKKLNLNSPYKTISTTLWNNKSKNTKQEKENIKLRTRIMQLKGNPQLTLTDDFSTGLTQIFTRLSEKYNKQQEWIRDIQLQIDERHFEELGERIKKIENKLKRQSSQVLKLQKKVKRSCFKGKQKQKVKTMPDSESNNIQYLQRQQQQLQTILQQKNGQAQCLQTSNKQLNSQLIQLLRIKRALKEQKAQSINKRP